MGVTVDSTDVSFSYMSEPSTFNTGSFDTQSRRLVLFLSDGMIRSVRARNLSAKCMPLLRDTSGLVKTDVIF